VSELYTHSSFLNSYKFTLGTAPSPRHQAVKQPATCKYEIRYVAYLKEMMTSCKAHDVTKFSGWDASSILSTMSFRRYILLPQSDQNHSQDESNTRNAILSHARAGYNKQVSIQSLKGRYWQLLYIMKWCFDPQN